MEAGWMLQTDRCFPSLPTRATSQADSVIHEEVKLRETPIGQRALPLTASDGPTHHRHVLGPGLLGNITLWIPRK